MTKTTLANIATVVRGVSFDKSDVSDSAGSGLLPILRAGNIEVELDLRNDLVWVPSSKVSQEQLLRPGDIPICMSSGSPAVVGKSAILRNPWQGSVGAFCAVVRANPKFVLPEFLAFFLRSYSFRVWTKNSSGSSIKNIKKSGLEEYPLALPGLDEQRRIVELLSRAESIFRMRRDAQQKAAELLPAIFLEMFGDPLSNPKGFSLKRLGAYLDIKSTVKLPDLIADADLPCIGADSIESSTGKIVAWPTVGEIRPISGKYFFEPADVLYSKIRPALRKAIIAPARGYCSADMYPLRVDSAVAVPEYVASLLLSNAFTEYAIGVSARAQMPKVNRETLFAYEHPMPPLSQQQVFAKLAQDIAAIAKQQVDATSKAEATFQALLSREFEILL